jgi:hypothetical protein
MDCVRTAENSRTALIFTAFGDTDKEHGTDLKLAGKIVLTTGSMAGIGFPCRVALPQSVNRSSVATFMLPHD